MIRLLAATLSILPYLVQAASDSEHTSKSRTPVTEQLSDGRSYQQGKFNNTLKWQSSGVLKHGGCPGDALIGDCYSMYLSEDGMLEPLDKHKRFRRYSTGAATSGMLAEILSRGGLYANYTQAVLAAQAHRESVFDPYPSDLLDDSPKPYFEELLANSTLLQNYYDDPDLQNYLRLTTTKDTSCQPAEADPDEPRPPPAPRQRIELYSWPPTMTGETWEYSWRTYLDSDTKATGKFFHMMQLLQRSDCGGFVIAEDAAPKIVKVVDKNRSCRDGICSSYDLNKYKGRTLQHYMHVQYGIDGFFTYDVTDLSTSKSVLSYNAVGDMGSSSSVKFGIYRAAVNNMGDAAAYVGDYSARQIL